MDKAIRVGVIGGSGLYQMEGLEEMREVRVETPFGAPSDALIVGQIAGCPVAFLPRHGRGHVHMPSEVPYRANIYALKQMGVEYVISISACGSLREALAPGHIVVPDQLFDFTHARPRSFFGGGWVAHVSVADPFCAQLSGMIADAVESAGDGAAAVHRGGAFITIEGPRFSTRAESRVYRTWGMDIIGMTAAPEAFLAREAGMCYGVMAHVTDYDVWHASEAPVTVEMVIERLRANTRLAQDAVRRLVPTLYAGARVCACADALRDALITDPTRVAPEARARVQALLPPGV